MKKLIRLLSSAPTPRTYGFHPPPLPAVASSHHHHPLPSFLAVRIDSQHPAHRRCLATSTATRASSNRDLDAIRSRRAALFDAEAERQRETASARLKKIKIVYEGDDETKVELWMNKDLSTPKDCAMHVTTHVVKRSVIALVDGVPWDMSRPLTDDASLRLLHFRDDFDPRSCNAAFWRSCSFVLGAALETAFREDVGARVRLCSFPAPNLEAGSFCYDVDLGEDLRGWEPSEEELKCLSAQVGRLHWEDVPFERLDVSLAVAQDIFRDDEFKGLQIPSIAEKSRKRKVTVSQAAATASSSSKLELGPFEPDGTISVYRLGDHVDISSGPMVPSTRFFQPGRYTVTAVFPIDSPSYGLLHRVQGVALPAGIPLHSHSYRILTKNASRLNSSPLPHLNRL